jgi:hypothetical protein
MRGLDEQERRAMQWLCNHDPIYENDGVAPARTWETLERRGLVVASCRCPWGSCECDDDDAEIRMTPLGQCILELDRIAREGGLGL